MNKTTFVQSILNGINNSSAVDLNDTGKQILTAQAAFECDWGTGTGYVKGNNPWNRTRSLSQIQAGMKVVIGPDTEWNAEGVITNIKQPWAIYEDLAKATDDLLLWCSRHAPSAMDALTRESLSDYLVALYNGHYFTLPVDKYLAGVQMVMDTVDGIVQSIGGYGSTEPIEIA